MKKLEFQRKVDTNYLISQTKSNNRFYETNIPLKLTSKILGIFNVEDSNYSSSWCVSDRGDVNIIDLKSRNPSFSSMITVSIFGDLKNMIITSCCLNHDSQTLYVGCKDGSIWRRTLKESTSLGASNIHNNSVKAIASSGLVLVSTGNRSLILH